MRCTSISTRPFQPARRRRPSGPVVLSEALAPFAPLPFVTRLADGAFRLIEEENADEDHPQSFGRMTAFHGQMGMFTRALTYILSHGADGLRQVAEDAVLNANYVLRNLEDVLDAPWRFGAVHARGVVQGSRPAEGSRRSIDAKGLIDEGYHPMTVYFPLVVHGGRWSNRPRPNQRRFSISSSARSVASRCVRSRAIRAESAPHFARARDLTKRLQRATVLAWNEQGDAAETT
jgi:glycine dehydrogenase subunit 2